MNNLDWRRVRSNKMGRGIIAMMHREAANKTVAMCRGSMQGKLRADMNRIEDDAIRRKVSERDKRLIKSACMRLVRIGHLVSKQKHGVRMYALPKNKEYL